jgi:hypothetical protein
MDAMVSSSLGPCSTRTRTRARALSDSGGTDAGAEGPACPSGLGQATHALRKHRRRGLAGGVGRGGGSAYAGPHLQLPVQTGGVQDAGLADRQSVQDSKGQHLAQPRTHTAWGKRGSRGG